MSENNPANQPPQYQGGNAPAGSAPAGPAPASVRRGAMLIYIAVGLGLLGAILGFFVPVPDQLQDVLNSETVTGLSTLVGTLVVYALGAFMAQKASQGKNWARITSTVFAGIAALGLLANIVGTLGLATYDGAGAVIGIQVLAIVANIVYITGNIFLWTGGANPWYAQQKRAY